MLTRAIQILAIGGAFVIAATSPASAQAGGAAPAEPVERAAAEAAAEETPPPAADASAAPAEPPNEVQTITAAQTNTEQLRKVTQQLEAVRHERDHTSTLAPWLLTSAGLAVIAIGLGYGVGRAMSCKHSCGGPFWPGWFVVAGSTIATAGAIWLVWKRDDIAELDRRKSYLERELQNLEWNRAANALPASPGLAFSWRTQF